MKGMIVGLTLIALIFSGMNPCLAKKANTGKVEKNVYTDSRFGFQITSLPNWKVKTQKEPSSLRVALTQKNYKISTASGASPFTTTIPTILILADTTSLSLAEVESCLFQKCEKLKNRDDYLIKLDLILNSETLGSGDVTVADLPARMHTLQQKYTRAVEDIRERSSSPSGGTVLIEDFLAGHVILFKKGNNLYIVQFSCEREFFDPTNEEFQKIIKSWKFIQ
jgi:hypothetical protein